MLPYVFAACLPTLGRLGLAPETDAGDLYVPCASSWEPCCEGSHQGLRPNLCGRCACLRARLLGGAQEEGIQLSFDAYISAISACTAGWELGVAVRCESP